jgi:hypothetical protein
MTADGTREARLAAATDAAPRAGSARLAAAADAAPRLGPARPAGPASRARPVPPVGSARLAGPAGPRPAAVRLAYLHVISRRGPAALAVIAVLAAGLRIALIGHWDAYGALQLPLVVEVTAAAVITVASGSPIGESERVAGRWLPVLRLATCLALTAFAAGALAAAGTGAHLAGGTLGVLRNVAGIVGIGLLCAAVFGAGLAWIGPTGYLLAGVYGLYTQWHPPTLTTPWLWPARPPHDLGAAVCAALLFAAGLAVITVAGARDSTG